MKQHKYIIGDRLRRNEHILCKVIEASLEYNDAVYRCEINEAGVITSKTVSEKYLDTWEKIIPPPAYTPKEVAFPKSVLKALKRFDETHNIKEFMEEVGGFVFELEDYAMEQSEHYRMLRLESSTGSSILRNRIICAKYKVYKELSDRIKRRYAY